MTSGYLTRNFNSLTPALNCQFIFHGELFKLKLEALVIYMEICTMNVGIKITLKRYGNAE